MRWISIILLTVLCGCGSGTGESTTNPYAASFAGYYYGSTQSDVYHYPACPSAKQISPSNLTSFSSADIAVTRGYRPCQICLPPQGSVITNAPTITIENLSKTVLPINAGLTDVTFRLTASDEDRNMIYIQSGSYTPQNTLTDSSDLDTGLAGISTITVSTWTLKIDTSIPGTHTIKATVTDNTNKTATATATVAVQ